MIRDRQNFNMRSLRVFLAFIGILPSVAGLPASAQSASSPQDADTLQSVFTSVYRSNPRLLGERARLREIDENYIQARAQGRPVIRVNSELSLRAARTPETASSFFNPSGGGGWTDGAPRSVQVDVIQPIYQGGRIKASKRQAKASIMAARANLENAENSIFLSAANAYVDVLRDEKTCEVRRNNVRVLTRQLTAASARLEVGEGTRIDTAQSQSRLAAAEAGLAQADAQLEISRLSFVRIIGRMPNQLSPPPDFILPQSLEVATTLARNNNPQLTAAYYSEKAGSAGIDVAKSLGRPSVNLQSSWSSSRQAVLGLTETDQVSLGLQLNVPIFTGGSNSSRVRQAKHAKTRLHFEARDVERAVDQAVGQAWVQIKAAERIIRTSKTQVDASNAAFDGVFLAQTVGTQTQLDVLDAEQEILDAELNLINAEQSYFSAVFELLSIIGVLDADGMDLPITQHIPGSYFSNVEHDGLKKAGDLFVPEAVQIIGKQIPEIVNEPLALISSGTGKLGLGDTVGQVGIDILELGNAVKEGVDTVTFQTPDYDPRTGTGNPNIVVPPDASDLEFEEFPG